MTITEMLDAQFVLSDQNRKILVARLELNIKDIQKVLDYLAQFKLEEPIPAITAVKK